VTKTETLFYVEDRRRGKWGRPDMDTANKVFNPYKSAARSRAAGKRLLKDRTWVNAHGRVMGVRIVMERVTRVERVVEVVWATT
jgi:hypothetical protein